VSEAAGGEGAEADAEAYDRLRRRVLWAMPTGLFVVGSRAGARRNLMTCNWAMQVATEPKLVAVSVESGSVTRELLEAGGTFSVSLLARSERALVRTFVKPVRRVELGPDGGAVALQGVPVVEVGVGPPRLAAAVAWIECAVRTVENWDAVAGPGASHVLVVGEVTAAGETPRLAGGAPDDAVLSMGDTRMSYGG
jgi:flavin reductase (DIM6/NTAB) family NADH-FMN oxidoreductase RutF